MSVNVYQLSTAWQWSASMIEPKLRRRQQRPGQLLQGATAVAAARGSRPPPCAPPSSGRRVKHAQVQLLGHGVVVRGSLPGGPVRLPPVGWQPRAHRRAVGQEQRLVERASNALGCARRAAEGPTNGATLPATAGRKIAGFGRLLPSACASASASPVACIRLQASCSGDSGFSTATGITAGLRVLDAGGSSLERWYVWLRASSRRKSRMSNLRAAMSSASRSSSSGCDGGIGRVIHVERMRPGRGPSSAPTGDWRCCGGTARVRVAPAARPACGRRL